MKKLIFFITLSYSFCTYSNAQITVGINAGMVVSKAKTSYKNPSSDFAIDGDLKAGVTLGTNIELLRKNNLSLIIDVNYVQKGYQIKIENTTENYPEGNGSTSVKKYNWDFLTLAPMAKYRYPIKSFAPFVFAGPRIDMFLTDNRSDYFLEATDYQNKLIFGVNYGLGIEYSFNTFRVLVKAYNQTDFTPFYDAPFIDNSSGLTLLNRAFILDFGISVDLN